MEDNERKMLDLERRIENLENPIVGEYYAERDPRFTCHGCRGWYKLYKKDILDEIDNNVKIGGPYNQGLWVEKSNIIMYDDISSKKKLVERKNKGRIVT